MIWVKLAMGTHYPYPNPYPLYLGRVWITHLNLDMDRVYMNNTRFTHVPISQFFSILLCSVAPLQMWGSRVGLATLLCTEQLPVILSHLQQISVNFDKNYNVNARFYFQGPSLDVGLTCNSCHTVLHKIAASHTESSPTNFSQF